MQVLDVFLTLLRIEAKMKTKQRSIMGQKAFPARCKTAGKKEPTSPSLLAKSPRSLRKQDESEFGLSRSLRKTNDEGAKGLEGEGIRIFSSKHRTDVADTSITIISGPGTVVPCSSAFLAADSPSSPTDPIEESVSTTFEELGGESGLKNGGALGDDADGSDRMRDAVKKRCCDDGNAKEVVEEKRRWVTNEDGSIREERREDSIEINLNEVFLRLLLFLTFKPAFRCQY